MKIVEKVKQSKGLLIVCHQRPDGDTFGSGFAFYFLAKHFGVPCDIVVDSDIPKHYGFMEDFDSLNQQKVKKYDLIITVDCADENRLGKFKDYSKKQLTINIDHHKSNTNFGTINIVEAEVSSTCEVVYKLLKKEGVFGEDYPSEMKKSIAQSLMVGLSTDTGHFMHSTVNVTVLTIAKELEQLGASVHQTANNLYRNDRKQRLALLAKIISKLEYYAFDKICVMTIFNSDIASADAEKYDTEGFIDYALNLQGTEVALSFTEGDPGEVKVSFRSKGADVSAVAAAFGGGGHKRAAGATIKGDFNEVKRAVIENVKCKM